MEEKNCLQLLFPSMKILYVNTRKIVPRLFIQHEFTTCVSAKSIDSNCWCVSSRIIRKNTKHQLYKK